MSSRAAPLALESREIATDRIIKGGALALGGVVVLAGGAFVGLSAGVFGYLAFIVCGTALFGSGALVAGRAASHLIRFGDARSSRVLMATAGMGVSVTALAATHLLQVLGWTPVVAGLSAAAMLGTFSFAALLLVYMLSALMKWVLSPVGGD